MWTAPKITSDAGFLSPLSLFNILTTLLFLTVAWDCTQAFVVRKKSKKKKTCRSAKTKLTCNLWYQARSKAEINAASKLA